MSCLAITAIVEALGDKDIGSLAVTGVDVQGKAFRMLVVENSPSGERMPKLVSDLEQLAKTALKRMRDNDE